MSRICLDDDAFYETIINDDIVKFKEKNYVKSLNIVYEDSYSSVPTYDRYTVIDLIFKLNPPKIKNFILQHPKIGNLLIYLKTDKFIENSDDELVILFFKKYFNEKYNKLMILNSVLKYNRDNLLKKLFDIVSNEIDVKPYDIKISIQDDNNQTALVVAKFFRNKFLLTNKFKFTPVNIFQNQKKVITLLLCIKENKQKYPKCLFENLIIPLLYKKN